MARFTCIEHVERSRFYEPLPVMRYVEERALANVQPSQRVISMRSEYVSDDAHVTIWVENV